MNTAMDPSTCQSCNQRFNSVFCKAHEDHINQINEQKSCSVFKKGEVLFSEGGRPQGVFCVSEGKIKMSHMGDDGKDQIIRLVKAGDILG